MIQNVLEGKKYRVITGYENNSVVSSDNNEEYMGYALNIYRYTGIVGAYGNTSLYSADDEYEENNVKINNEIFETNGIDFSQYLGMKVTAYYKADDSGYYIMHVVADKKSEMIEVKSEDIAENMSKEKFEYYDNNKIKKAKISDNATFIYNGKKLDVVSDADLQADNGYVRLISNNGGSTYDTVIIKDYETFIVDKAIATDSLLYFKYDKGSLDLSSESNINAKYFAEGKEADFSSISTGSILSIAMSKNTIGNLSAEILISNNQVTGNFIIKVLSIMPYLKTERNTFLQMNIFQDLTKVKAVHMSRQSVMKAYFTLIISINLRHMRFREHQRIMLM